MIPLGSLALVLVVLLFAGCTPGTHGSRSADPTTSPANKKAIWGPATAHAFRLYHQLGASIYQTSLAWHQVAPTRPRHPRDPADPAYDWPPGLDRAVRLAADHRMRLCVELTGAPPWANGGRPSNWAPEDAHDFADFAFAASRRYPSVHLWAIWGEPSRAANFMPLTAQGKTRSGGPPPPLSGTQRVAPHNYARILDAAYGALKEVSPRNLVIGGDTFTTGDISPYNWIRNLRLPNGRPPRMDMYGHNPFSLRRPVRHGASLGSGYADFSSLGELEGWIDRFLAGRAAGPRRLPLYLLEYTAPTDHDNREFNFWVDRRVQARWLAAALRIVRASPRIYAIAWLSLYDDPPTPDGKESRKGLVTAGGLHKPSYHAYQHG